MKAEDFRNFLKAKNISENEIGQFVSIAAMWEDFLKESERSSLPASGISERIDAFSTVLIEKKLNTRATYRALLLYGQFLPDNGLYTAVTELVDGAEAMDNLYDKVAEAVGQGKRDEVFEGIELPPLGTPSVKKPRVTEAMMERLEAEIGPETCTRILSGCLRDVKDEWFPGVREKYLKCRDLDEYLERKGQAFVAELDQITSFGLVLDLSVDPASAETMATAQRPAPGDESP